MYSKPHYSGDTFKYDYLKLQGSASTNATKTATLATCTNAYDTSSGITCSITCTKVTGAEAVGLYILSTITAAASQNVFSSSANAAHGITLANEGTISKSYEGQSTSSSDNTNNNNDTYDGNCLKYYLVSLLSLLLF